ncbi:MAG: peptidyl-dipeptidase [Deltaproteobacteria bacterium CG2_30_63_29]|nr:MAG: peptidyl-dipeptidase [Deltaproteobacteria bacterium CG2_30_63_29]
MKLRPHILFAVLSLSLAACGGNGQTPETPPEGTTAELPSPAAAAAFVDEANASFREVWVGSESAAWDYYTNINDETAAALSKKEEASMEYTSIAIKRAATFDGLELTPDIRRQLDLIKLGSTLPAPDDAAKRAELANLSTEMSGLYGKGKYCKGEDCRDLGQLEDVLATSQNYDELLDAWEGWRTVSPPLEPMYERFVELSNEGAKEIGFEDTGALWRSGYDMPPAEFEAEVERLWSEVEPLYKELHCYTRAKLAERYGADKVPLDGPIPAHLLGNMWSQSWENLYPLLEPNPGQPSLDMTSALVAANYDPIKMVKTGEAFFTSLGLDPLPATFWERSMFSKPEAREVVCHASAWDVTYSDDLRIKMCIKINMEDLVTIHHELGHDYYYHYYYTLPILYQAGANDGFHEGIGDALALSITPAYLHQIGLMDEVTETPELVINKQMQDALAKIAFLPFGRMIDQWRWDVFSGKVTPDQYNQHWWDLRLKFQGVAAPRERPANAFDPGAKYHIPANTPYMRYFLAAILQFQFHKAMCEAAGYKGPLHTCSIYGSKEAGARLQAMLELGASKPWPDALEAMTGTRQMSAEPMLEYFAPLRAYLTEQNAGRSCGW